MEATCSQITHASTQLCNTLRNVSRCQPDPGTTSSRDAFFATVNDYIANDEKRAACAKRLALARDACLLLQKELVGIDFYLCALASRESPSSSDKRRRPDLDEDDKSPPKRAAPAPKMPDVPMAR